MNRRSYLKKTLLVGILGAGAVGTFKLFRFKDRLSKEHFYAKRSILEVLVDILIPATDTPGAKEALAHDYVINVISECTSPREQSRFYTGLEDLEKYSDSKYGRPFIECTLVEQHDVVNYYAEHTGYSVEIFNRITNKVFGKPFYSKLRTLTVEGYCLSKLGATQGLAYDYIPGNYQSCIPLKANQKSWATK